MVATSLLEKLACQSGLANNRAQCAHLDFVMVGHGNCRRALFIALLHHDMTSALAYHFEPIIAQYAGNFFG